MLIARTSPLTGIVTMRELPVTEEQMEEMRQPSHERRLVQDIFPQLTAEEREFIKTGYTQQDWDQMFPKEDEDETR